MKSYTNEFNQSTTERKLYSSNQKIHVFKGEKKLEKSWGGDAPPPKITLGGGRETLRHPPVFALVSKYKFFYTNAMKCTTKLT